MKDRKYAQIGKRSGMTAYRTSSKFIYKGYLKSNRVKTGKLNRLGKADI